MNSGFECQSSSKEQFSTLLCKSLPKRVIRAGSLPKTWGPWRHFYFRALCSKITCICILFLILFSSRKITWRWKFCSKSSLWNIWPRKVQSEKFEPKMLNWKICIYFRVKAVFCFVFFWKKFENLGCSIIFSNFSVINGRFSKSR